MAEDANKPPLHTAHHTVRVERNFAAPREAVFRAWVDERALPRWYLPDGEARSLRILEHDVRVGGCVRLSFGPGGGPAYLEQARYEDIVEFARLCYALSITRDGERMAISLVTIIFSDDEVGTQVQITDQLALFNASDTPAEREQGWSETFDRLAIFLSR